MSDTFVRSLNYEISRVNVIANIDNNTNNIVLYKVNLTTIVDIQLPI